MSDYDWHPVVMLRWSLEGKLQQHWKRRVSNKRGIWYDEFEWRDVPRQPVDEIPLVKYPSQETKVAEPDPPPPGSEDWWHLKPYGYAPGGYIIRCHTCKQQAWNCDKRALNCASCATKAWRKANEQG